MQPGIYSELSNTEYHGGPGISKSGLDLIRRSPLHFNAAKTAANDNQPTEAQATGTAFHTLLLEPGHFVKDYTLALRRSDVPDAIDDRDVLVGMVQELNATRLPKLTTGGNKADLVERVITGLTEAGSPPPADEVETIKAMKLDELKASIELLNKERPGLLPIGGSRHELADLLRANGKPVRLWSDVQAQWLQNNDQRIVLGQEQWDQLHAMRDAVMNHPAARALLTGAPAVMEYSCYWVDETTGELCRCRPDIWRLDGILADVKTTDDASEEAFSRSIVKWRYHVQAPYYIDGVNQALAQAEVMPEGFQPAKAKAFVFIAVEKKFPHAVAVYALDQASMNLGRIEYRQDLDLFAQCKRTSIWPGYGDKIQTIGVPQWKINQNAHLLEDSAA